MIQLRKSISYILPLIIAGILLSVVVSVFSAEFTGYIGKIDSSFEPHSTLEIFTLNIYNSSQLIRPSIGIVKIYKGGDDYYEPYYGDPIGLITTAFSAQAQRTRVSITTVPIGADYRVVKISQLDTPDDIAGMFSGLTLSNLDNSIATTYSQVLGRGSLINGIESMNVDTITVSGVVNGKVSSQQTQITNIYNEDTALNGTLVSVSAQASTLTPLLTNLTATSDSLFALTGNVNNRIISVGGSRFTTFDTHLRTQFDSIDSRLASQNSLLTAIWNKIRPPSRGGCFLRGTPILMADGRKKPIEEIKVGDVVLAYDQESKELKPDKVTELFRHPKEDSYLIINGQLKVTAIHPVLSKGKWIHIGDLKLKDTLTDTKGRDVPIKSIKVVKEPVDVYNFEVNPYHTYIAGGYIVHNKKVLQQISAP